MKIYLVLLAISTNALAASAPDPNTIYTWGYGPFMFEQLHGLANMMDDGFAIKIAGAIGILSMVFKKLLDSRTSHVIEVGRFLMLSIFIYFGFMVSVPGHNTYNIKDVTNGYATQVSGVPLIIGKSFAFFSSAEYLIAQAIERSFSLPNSVQYANAGFAFPLASHESIANAKPIAPYVQQSMDEFVANCLLYAIDEGTIDPTTLYNSEAVYDDMAVNDPSRVTIVYSSTHRTGEVQGCDVAQGSIKTMLINEVGNMESVAAASMGAISKYSAVGNVVSNKATDVADTLFNISKSSQEYIMQAATINAMQRSFSNVAKISGINTYALAYGTATAERQAQTNFLISGKLAQKYLPVLKGVLTLTIVGISWLLALLALAYFDMKYLWMVFTLQIWLMLWTPIAAVYNHIQLMMVQSILEPYSSVGGWYTINNKSVVDNEVLSALSWMGYIGWLIPLFAYAISKGSDHAFTMMANSLSGAMGGATGAAAGEVSRGNIQLGEVRAGHREVVSNGAAYSEGGYGEKKTNAFNRDNMVGTVEETWNDGQRATTHSLAGKSITTNNNGETVGTNAIDTKTAGQMKTGVSETMADIKSNIQAYSKEATDGASALVKQGYGQTNGTTHQKEDSEAYAQAERLDQVTRDAFAKAYDSNDAFAESVNKSLSASIGTQGAADFMKDFKRGRGSVRPNANGGWTATDAEGTSHTLSRSERDTFESSLSETTSAAVTSGSLQKVADSTSRNSSEGKEWNKNIAQLSKASAQIKDEKRLMGQAQKAMEAMDTFSADKSAGMMEYIKDHYNDTTSQDGVVSQGRELKPDEALSKMVRYGSGELDDEGKERIETLATAFMAGGAMSQDRRSGNKNKIATESAKEIDTSGVPSTDEVPKRVAAAQDNAMAEIGDHIGDVAGHRKGGTSVDPLEARELHEKTLSSARSNAQTPSGCTAEKVKSGLQETEMPIGAMAATMLGSMGMGYLANKALDHYGEKALSPDESHQQHVEREQKIKELEGDHADMSKEYDRKLKMSDGKLGRENLGSLVQSQLDDMTPTSPQYDETRRLLDDIHGGKSVSVDDLTSAGFSQSDLSENGFVSQRSGGSLGGDSGVIDFEESGRQLRSDTLGTIKGDIDGLQRELAVEKASFAMGEKIHNPDLSVSGDKSRMELFKEAIDGGGGWKSKVGLAASALVLGNQSEVFATALSLADPVDLLTGSSIARSSELEHSEYRNGGHKAYGWEKDVVGEAPDFDGLDAKSRDRR